MADLNLPSFAGTWDPTKASKFGWYAPQNLPSFGSFSLTEPSDPYAALKEKYGKAVFDPSTLTDKEAQGMYALSQGFQPNINTLIAQAEIQKIGAQEANKMSRKNLQLVEEAEMRAQERAEQRAVRQQGREFTYNQAANLFSAIPRAFSPIPLDRTQEVVANIANISSPRNITAIPQVNPAGFSYTPTKYFR